MVGDEWKSASADLAHQIAMDLSASLTTRLLTERLTELTLHPANSDATDIRLIVSQSDVIVNAGSGTHIELPPLPESEAQLVAIVRAIASGTLNESTQGGLVRYHLLLADGGILQGRSMRGLPLGRRTSVCYSPFSTG
jgi:hypothetical protein